VRQSFVYGDGLRHDEHLHGRLATDVVAPPALPARWTPANATEAPSQDPGATVEHVVPPAAQ
jgi:hypothetical protein